MLKTISQDVTGDLEPFFAGYPSVDNPITLFVDHSSLNVKRDGLESKLIETGRGLQCEPDFEKTLSSTLFSHNIGKETSFEDYNSFDVTGALKPLFAEYPSVMPNYTGSLTRVIGREIHISTNNINNDNISNVTSRDDVIETPKSRDTALHAPTYFSFLNDLSLRMRLLNALRTAGVKPKGVDHDYLYNLSAYKKFTEERPKTHVFYRGRTYTYDKLPPFPARKRKDKVKSKKNTIAKSKNIEEPMMSSLSNKTSVTESSLNPLSPAFNINFVNSKDCNATLRELRTQNVNNIVIAHVNINSLRNKFDSLVQLVSENVDILVIGETKLDMTFPKGSFRINGFKSPYRRDRNIDGGGVMIYVREDIACQEKDHDLQSNVEAILVEINLRKSKFLLIGTYHSTHKTHGTSDDVFLQQIGTVLDKYSSYDKFLIAGDMNMQEGETHFDDFLDEFHARNMVKEPTCFKNPDNPSCIDLFITNGNRSFMKTMAVSTGLSDFHKMIVTVMRTTFPKREPQIIKYRDFSKYNKVTFGNDLRKNLENQPSDYDTFEKLFLETLEIHAPKKTKVLRANHKPYVSKEMRKAIMIRSRLQNKLFTYGTKECETAFKHQRNYCNRLCKREKKKFYNNLNLNEITDNKKFWKTMKPFFGDKGGSKDQIVLVEGDKILNKDAEIAQTLNDFFDDAVRSLGISERKMLLNEIIETQGRVMDAIKMYESHPSILKIKENVVVETKFSFSPISIEDIHSEIKCLNTKKAIPFMNIPPKQVKDVIDIIDEPLTNIWNDEILGKLKFPRKLKLADISPIHKKWRRPIRNITGQLACSQLCQRSLKG